jgi:competence protein ComEA
MVPSEAWWGWIGYRASVRLCSSPSNRTWSLAGQGGSGGAAPGPSTSCNADTAARPPRCPAVPLTPAPLNINTATASELDALPGIGPAKAAAILRYREERGPFTDTEDLTLVPGFGPALVARLESQISVR